MEKIYLVYYFGGCFDDFYRNELFVTKNIQTAIEYCNKFNRILTDLKEHYSKFEEDSWLKVEFEDSKWNSWKKLTSIDKSHYREILVK